MTDEQDKDVPVDTLAATVRDALQATDRYGGINHGAFEALAELVARATQAETDRDEAERLYDLAEQRVTYFEALTETEWQAFIGWQPSIDREQTIQSADACLREALSRLGNQHA